MAGHPEVMPDEHADRDGEHACIEQFLPETIGPFRHDFGKHREKRAAGDPSCHAARNPPAAAGDETRRGEHNADDETGFEDFTEDDDECAEHVTCPEFNGLLDDDLAGRFLRMEIVEEAVGAGRLGTNIHQNV